MEILSLFRYIASVVLEGEATNKWLYELPQEIRDPLYDVGMYIVSLLFP
jgi:hypothetical protein